MRSRPVSSKFRFLILVLGFRNASSVQKRERERKNQERGISSHQNLEKENDHSRLLRGTSIKVLPQIHPNRNVANNPLLNDPTHFLEIKSRAVALLVRVLVHLEGIFPVARAAPLVFDWVDVVGG